MSEVRVVDMSDRGLIPRSGAPSGDTCWEHNIMSFKPLQDMQFSLSGLQDEINRLAERVWHAGLSTGPLDGQPWAPVIDLYEYPDRYTLFAEIPGVDSSSVDLNYIEHSRELTVRGDKIRSEDVSETDRPMRGERRFGAFSRTVTLPADIVADKLTAKCHNGVLVVTIPKTEASRPKAIRVEVEE